MHRIRRGSLYTFLIWLTLAASCRDVAGPVATPLESGPEETTPVSETPRSTPPASTADSGILRIVTTTSGTDRDPDGYTVRLYPSPYPSLLGEVELPFDGTMISGAVGVSGSLDLTVVRRMYAVWLDGVAPNCTVPMLPWWGSRREVRVQGGAPVRPVTELSFEVTCEPEPKYGERLPSGTELAFVRDGQIWRVNSDGSGATRLTTGPGDSDPAWSPDGQRIAFARSEGQNARGQPFTSLHLYLMDADGSNVVRLTGEAYGRQPAWAPDGRRLAFSGSCIDGNDYQGCIRVISADPNDATSTRIGWPRGWHDSPTWSPDGTRIAFSSDWVAHDMVSDLYVATVGSAEIDRRTSTFEWRDDTPWSMYYQPAWSPDGRHLAVSVCPNAYLICEAGTVAIMNADGSGKRALVSARGYARPTWSPDGRTIAFASAGSILWSSVDGASRGIIVENGVSPAWRP